jgi:hypothetical protein
LSESHVVAAGLINTDGKLLPGVFKFGSGGNRFLTIDKEPLFLIKGTTKKNLLDEKNAEK